jgi:uncharacterized membrane protein
MHPSILYALTFVPVFLIIVSVAVLNWRRRLTHSSQPNAVVRTGSLNVSETNETGWRLGLLSTLLLIVGAATLLAIRWQTIPERFPIHWGISGQPNGWADRGLGSVFGPLLFTIALVVALGLLGELIGRSSPGHVGRATMIGTVRTILIASSWLVTTLLCSISLLPLAHDSTNLVPFLTLGAVVFGLAVVGYAAMRAVQMKQIRIAGQNSTDGHFWKAGLFYFNPSDSALMVPKRKGFGYTLNFGRPVSWLIAASIVLLPLMLPLFLYIHNRT